VDVWFSPEQPDRVGGNWVQTLPGKFEVDLRILCVGRPNRFANRGISGALGPCKGTNRTPSRGFQIAVTCCSATTFTWGRLGDLNPGPTHYELNQSASSALRTV
jgi:hypothetical protein